jgi:serine/threonine protein kinase
MRNLVDGLFIMHDNNYCHLYIKENNILIGSDNIARFIDFGMSNSITNPYVKWSGSTEGWYPKISGLYAFNSYQLLNVDIYHLGLIFYFILLNDGDLIAKVNEFFENKSNATSEDFYNYLNSLVYDLVNQGDVYVYNKIIQFIKNNHMLDFEFLNIAGPGRMRQIRDNFYLKFPNAD